MKPYTTRLLTTREQHQSQYHTVTDGDTEICRTDCASKAGRVARALALLDHLETLEASLASTSSVAPLSELLTTAD